MGALFWLRRFLTVLLSAFIIIGGVQLLKGHSLTYAATQGAIWASLSATIFTVGRFFQARRGQHCVICNDTPEMAARERSDQP